MFAWAGERPPDVSAPLDCDCERGAETLFSYAARCGGVADSDEVPSLESVIETISTQRTMAMLWPMVESGEPFIVVGPEGCGKNLMIRHAFAARRKVSVATLHCSARTDASHVIVNRKSKTHAFDAVSRNFAPCLRVHV